ncbi:LCP family protein [Listeria riparia]|uniref:Regulatory protein MsrR n=1 Tax=Listeria riparia FSL S10-1204 TaxID=1265816 RepID=W7DJ34_9LIST|nr:LCP family protein [Listeria riparia]EUJ45373.1 putative transcriptional regulator, LytR family protein [Listeria riparia FSL S10-1204]
MATRQERNTPTRKKKLRKGRTIFAIILVLIVAIAGIGFYQYKSSLSAAQSDNQMKDFKFNGEQPEDVNDLNVLLIGSDSRGKDQGRSDSLLIAHYDTKSKKPKLVSIMRDTYVDIPGHGLNKINAAYSFGGPELVRQTIKKNFGVNLEYYVVANFEGFPKIVDTLAPDGIEINAEKDMSKNIEANIKAGKQKMDGATLLQYARFRHDAESDFGRVRRQQQVLTALKDQVQSIGTITKLPSLIGTMQGYTNTNVTTGMMLSIGKDFVLGKTDDIKDFRLPVDGTYKGERTSHGDVLDIDVAANAKALQDFLKD